MSNDGDDAGTGGTSQGGGTGGTGAFGGVGGSIGANGGTGGTSAGRGGSGGASGSGGGAGGTPANAFPCGEGTTWNEHAELCANGLVHRTEAGMCSRPPRDDEVGGAAGAAAELPAPTTCATDADCGPSAYCIADQQGNFVARSCLFACDDDRDCVQGALCLCQTFQKASSNEFVSFGSCVTATCRSDDECGEGRVCGANPKPGACGTRPTAFGCQTPADTCASRADCSGNCELTNGSFQCQNVGVCGRPFLVDGLARRAPAVERSDWLDPSLGRRVQGELTHAERAAVAEHWLEIGAMEHASIAAFARFSLELLALGAPPELLDGATRALADETAHARLAYGIAARYSESTRGPAPLDVTGALERVELLAVVERALLEGCIGETSAALEAAWAADDATEPDVQGALERIAADEARHAALAFEFVAWAASRDARVAELATRVLARVTAELSPETPWQAPAATRSRLAAHGVLAPDLRRDARRAALREVIPAVWSALRDRKPGRPTTTLEELRLS